MPQQVRGVIARAKGKPVEIATITIPDPGPGEVVVKVATCGVCHTDLTYRDGGINDEFPFLLGHEAAGFVESVGAGVDSVQVGDFVVLNWRAVCGQCRACKRGRPQYCFDTFNAAQKMTLEDGTELTPALGIGAFADKTLVHAGQCTKVDPAADPAVVGLLGCGVMAGLGAAVNTGNVARGDSVAVIGCGGVGDAAIVGARLAGRVNDHRDRPRSQKAAVGRGPRRHPHVNAAAGGHRRGGAGADRRLRRRRGHRRGGAPGNLEAGVLRTRPRRHRRAGWRAHAGHDTGDAAGRFFSRGGALKSSWYGDCLPERDFPTLVDLYQQGRLPLEKFVSERIKLDDVEEAFHTMHAGEVLRSVVVL